MSDIRENIFSAVKSRLEGITVAGGYRTTIDTVEINYRDPSRVGTAERPYIGIVFLDESYRDEPGRVITEMRLALACYLTPSAATYLAVVTSLSNLAADVRKALYASPQNLSVDGVIAVRMARRQGTEGLTEAAQRKDASMIIEVAVKFWEDYTA